MMRGSAVVQSFKSFASKLHPQLPLGPKESQKLFVALTTAFQNELDQAHPRQADDNATLPALRRSSTTGPANDGKHTSSATLADRHLAAVLTNPLLAPMESLQKPVLDINSAQAALEKDPARDAVSLLEEYEKKGAASLAIAALCLKAHNQRVDSLPEKDRERFMAQSAAGKRCLLCLWRSKYYEDPVFLANPRFQDDLLLLLAREGEEEFLMTCLKLGKPPMGPVPSHSQDRWKLPIYRQIVTARFIRQNYTSADSALDAVSGWMEEGVPIEKGDASFRIPINGAVMRVCEVFASSRRVREGTDPARFDKFLSTVTYCWGDRPRGRLAYARLCLMHPRQPTPVPALQLLKTAFDSSNPDEGVRDYLLKPHSERARTAFGSFFARTAAQLQAHKRPEDAEWVLSLAQWIYPKDKFPDKRVPLPARQQEPSELGFFLPSLT